MKISKWLFVAIMAFSTAFSTQQAAAQSVSVNFSLFHDRLGVYGTWVNNPRYGQVWMYSEPGFRPYYSNGHWDYTDYGWSWVSDYDWGWAPFHYGRWEFDDFYNNWIWIPGYEWAPAWVAWSEADDYYGWAPLGYGVGINVSFGSIRQDRWVFAPRQYINSPRIHDYYVPAYRNRIIIRNNVTIINNRYGRRDNFMRGPDRQEAERFTRNRIQERRITDNDRFGRRDVARNDDRGRNNNFPQNNRTDNRQYRNDDRTGTWGNRNGNFGENRTDNRQGRDNGAIDRRDNTDRRDNRQNDNGGYQRKDNIPNRDFNGGRSDNNQSNTPQTPAANPGATPAPDRNRQMPSTDNRANTDNRQRPSGGWDRSERQQERAGMPQRDQNRATRQPQPVREPNYNRSQPEQRTQQPQQQPSQRSFENRRTEQPSPGGNNDRMARRRG